MRIALIGGRDEQQFPTISYGGIETCVENLAWGMHQNNNDFVCVVPKRNRVLAYPFEIVESSVPPMPGPESNVWPFANSLPDLVRKINPDIIWSQGFWSAETLQGLGIPIICTFHDILKVGARPNPNWFRFRSNTWYRFISKYQYDAWVDPLVSWQGDRCFQLYTGLADDEYDFGQPVKRRDYYLWVGGFSWGWHGKGLDIFIELARRNQDKHFVAFGTGNKEIEKELKKQEGQLSNFKFPGRLNRGQAHREVFKKARLYVMPTQIPDTFPRTVLESISKGTPVLGTKNGALPEMIGEKGGFIADSIEEMENILNLELNYNSCFEYSKAFGIDRELESLLNLSQNLLRTC